MSDAGRIPVVIALALTGILAGGALAAVAGAQEDGAMGVEAEHSVELYPETPEAATATRNPITVGFNGRVYQGGWWLGRIGERALTADEQFIVDVLEGNRERSPEEVLELWHPAERDDLRELVTNPEIFEKNRRFYRGVADSALVAKVLYGSYSLFFVQHVGADFEDFIKVYPIVESRGEYYLTNALQADPVFQYFATAYAETLDLVERPASEGGEGGA